MTILPSTASLLARQVRLIISPPTTTLFESRAILSDVQSRFGSISTFITQRNDLVLHQLLRSATKPTTSSAAPRSQTALAIFNSPASKTSALDSGSLTVSCGGELWPSAKELDPYNARGFRRRHHPPKRTFTCHIVEEKNSTIHQRLAENHPYSGPFRVDTLQMSYGDLGKGGAPLIEMADVMQAERPVIAGEQQDKEEYPTTPGQGFYSHGDKLRDPQRYGGLMAGFRWGNERAHSKREPLS